MARQCRGRLILFLLVFCSDYICSASARRARPVHKTGGLKWDSQDTGGETPTAVGDTISALDHLQNGTVGSKNNTLEFALSVCQVSCNGRCNWAHGLISRFDGSCFCDNQCQIYGDCCLDYYMNCNVPSLVEGMVLADNASLETRLEHHAGVYSEWLQKQPEEPVSTCKIVFSASDLMSYNVIDKCPGKIVPALEQYRLNCENTETVENVMDRLTLIQKLSSTRSRGSLFVNIYCAQCNGVFLETDSVNKLPPAAFRCGNNSTKPAETVLRQVGSDAFRYFIATNCTPVYNPIREKHPECLSRLSFVDSCNKSMVNEVTNYEELNRACKVYRQDVISENDPSVVYKNPHCALCNRIKHSAAFKCFEKEAYKNFTRPLAVSQGPDEKAVEEYLSSYSTLMKFSEDNPEVLFNKKTVCPAGYFLDMRKHQYHTCTENNCPFGQIPLHGNCSELQWAFDTALPSEMRETYVIIYRIANTTSITELAMTLFSLAFKLIEHPVVPLNISVDSGCGFLSEVEQSLGIAVENQTMAFTSDVCVSAEIAVGLDVESSFWDVMESTFPLISPPVKGPMSETVTQLLAELSERGFPWQLYSQIRVHNIYLLNHNLESVTPKACPEGSTQITSRGDSVALVEQNDENGFPFLAFRLSDTGIDLAFESTPALLSFIPSHRSGIFHRNITLLTSHCQPSILTCDKVMFSRSDVILTAMRKLRIRGYRTEIEPAEYAKVGEDLVFVCRAAVERSLPITHGNSKVEVWLTFGGILLSLLGIAITLFTYALFPSLRTRPGLCIMCLSASLFLAQLLFTFGPRVADLESFDSLCIILGSAQHYSWLAAFFWMNVLAFDAAITFGRKVNTPQPKTYSPRFRLFLLYAFGIPALIVSVCLFMDQFNVGSLDYICLSSCWLNSGQTLLMVFGIPLALVVLLNIILFVKTTVALNTSMNIAEDAKTSNGQNTNRLVLYTKLFCVMGLSWLLGFVSEGVDLQWLTYLFIVANSLQGFFICLSFGLTARTLALYRNRFGFGNTDSVKKQTDTP